MLLNKKAASPCMNPQNVTETMGGYIMLEVSFASYSELIQHFRLIDIGVSDHKLVIVG